LQLANNGQLILSSLSKGFPGITPAFGATLAEAGAVCLEDQNHSNGVVLKVAGSFQAAYQIFWDPVTTQMLNCWNDPPETTEQGAYGIAFLLIIELTEDTIIRRSFKGTGFDYWLGKKDDISKLPFQNAARLEVSGIRNGDGNVKSRVKQKINQTIQSDSTQLPAYIVVVEFSVPSSQVIKK
jgi:hypothetical protein